MAAATAMAPHPPPSPLRQGSITPMLGSSPPRTGSTSPRSPRSPRGRRYRPQSVSGPEYDPMLDEHQQVYVMTPRMMETLRNTMHDHGRPFTDPKDKIGFHGPRRPLLHSYPMSPRCVGKAMLVTTYREKGSTTPRSPSPPLPQNKEGKALIRLAHDLRTSQFYDDLPGWKKLRRAKNVAPPMSRFEKLAKEKGFILDGVALSSIQDDYARVQPKLGPAIPPYNSHYDKHVRNYFAFKGVAENLKKTGQMRENSVSIQGKAVDHFYHNGIGKDYIERRNKDGAGNAKILIDGHDQYLRDTKPMNTYNGKFGFRRNTPTLRNCPSPFGTASRSSTF